jgi:hypothetical protein
MILATVTHNKNTSKHSDKHIHNKEVKPGTWGNHTLKTMFLPTLD